MINKLLFALILSSNSIACLANYNPWYFDLDCDTYMVQRSSQDRVDVFKYNPRTQAYEWFQNLSEYAQKIDYFMEGFGKHHISVTDESGHLEIYKWRYPDPNDPNDQGEFYLWG
jgi:hypothetical protein